jgi:hypothetical protein
VIRFSPAPVTVADGAREFSIGEGMFEKEVPYHLRGGDVTRPPVPSPIDRIQDHVGAAPAVAPTLTGHSTLPEDFGRQAATNKPRRIPISTILPTVASFNTIACS